MKPMRHLSRIVLWAVLVGVTPMIAGCADFDPDKLDIFGLNEKKKLPGERQDLFPQGVPGVTQGIPPEYLKGNQPAADAATAVPPAAGPQQQQVAAPAAAPVEPQKPKPKPKRTVKRTSAPKPAPAAASAPVTPVQSGAAQQPASSGWPAPAQGTTSSSSGAWPAPQPSGTFQR
ncbi:MAG: hypothetical protein WC670_15710 [Pseudolabrys sp.]|jgi:hypothetical protein